MIRQTTIFFFILEFALGLVQNPCNDVRYLQIKNKSLDNMSDREYSYFLQKEKECNEYTIHCILFPFARSKSILCLTYHPNSYSLFPNSVHHYKDSAPDQQQFQILKKV